tara:strand:+ start:33 stop:572 length:540 start_codon:yes stop_codon:yes gene_type:complete
MFFNFYTSSQSKNKEIIDSFYYKIVKISRNKAFYSKLSVPDTIDGRYDLLVLFSIMLTFHLSKCGSRGQDLSQNLFDKIFLDLDLSLRELGAGDAGVHIKIKQMVKSYMGRQQAYCNCLEVEDFDKFKKHIVKNVYRNINDFGNSADLLTEYCKKINLQFNKKNSQYFLSNKFAFPLFE